jgi:AcrR family transcriptional regulator
VSDDGVVVAESAAVVAAPAAGSSSAGAVDVADVVGVADVASAAGASSSPPPPHAAATSATSAAIAAFRMRPRRRAVEVVTDPLRGQTVAVGRPRDSEVDARIAAAARQLLARGGDAAVTIAAVADLAGVGRPTVYRRWPTRAALLFELHSASSVPSELPDLGSLRAELTAATRHLAATMAGADREIVAEQYSAMIRDPVFADRVWQRRWEYDREAVMVIWRRAVDRGEVRSGADGELLFDHVVAICLFQTYLAHRTLTDDEVDELVDRLLAGVLVPRRLSG